MTKELLLIEHSLGDVRLMEEVFREVDGSVRIHVARDGVEAMRFLRREDSYVDAPRPDLILLDLNLPQMDGREVLAQIKRDENLKTIPTIVVTVAGGDADVTSVYELRANCYLVKPGNLEAYHDLVESIDDFWLKRVKLPRHDGR